MSDDLVLKAFQKAVIAAVAASTLSTLPIKAVGRTFEIPNDQKYLEIIFIPNNPSDRYWGDEQLFQGIFRLILHWPDDDQGVYPPMKVAQSIASYFTKSKTLTSGALTLNIYETPKLTGVIGAGHETIYPISLVYRSFNP